MPYFDLPQRQRATPCHGAFHAFAHQAGFPANGAAVIAAFVTPRTVRYVTAGAVIWC